MVRVELKGADELIDKFEKMGKKGEEYINSAYNEIGMESASAMQVDCPVKTGRLISSIHWETFKSKKLKEPFRYRPKKLELVVGTNVEYAMDVNYGTKPHIIRVKNANVLASRVVISQNIKTQRAKYGWVYFGKEVKHPGTRGYHFFEAGVENINEILIPKLRKKLELMYAEL